MSFAISPSGVKMTLENQTLWEQFHPNTEMIVHKKGRQLFPHLKYTTEGLDSQTLYSIYFHLERVDTNKYKYVNQEWRDAGRGEPILPTQYKMHPDGARLGSHWMEKTVSFSHIKLTNDPENKNDKCILVQSMHKYRPVVTVTKVNQLGHVGEYQGEEFRLELTQFIVGTQYQSDKMAALKIAHNPFASGFRLNGKRCKSSSNSENTSPTETKRGSTSSDSSSSSRSSTVSPPTWNPSFNNQLNPLMFNHNPYPPAPFPFPNPNQYYDGFNAGNAPNPYWYPYFQGNQWNSNQMNNNQ